MTSAKQGARPLGRPTLSWLRMVWKHRWLSAAIFTVLSIASGIVIYKLPAIYRAEALILVDGQKIPERYVVATVNAELQDRLATISQRILSSTRLMKIIESYDLYHDERKTLSQEEVVEKMRADVKVAVEKGWSHDHPGAFRVSYEGKSPTVVAEVSNQIANLFIEENLRARETNAEGTAAFLESELEQSKKALDELELKVRQYKTEHNGQLPQQENSLLGNLARLQVELQGNQDAINRAQQSKMMLDSAISIAESSQTSYKQVAQSMQKRAATTAATSSGSGPSGESAAPTRTRAELLEQQLEVAKQRYTDNHPAIAYLKEQLAAARKLDQKDSAAAAAAATTKKAAPVPASTAPAAAADADGVEPPSIELAQNNIRDRERMAVLKTQIELANRDLELRNSERQRILEKINTLQAKVETLPLREQEMMALTRDYEMSKAHYQSLLDKKMAAEMASNLERRQQSERFTLLDPARVPERPIKPNRPAFTAICLVLSLVIGLAIGVGTELKQDLVLGEWEMPPDVAILGRVPSIAPASAGNDAAGAGTPGRRQSPAAVSLGSAG